MEVTMDWLKKLLGDRYKDLGEEAINLLKSALGDTEYIANDPTKVIPKHVFNEKNEELKLLKNQLKEQGELITDTEMKTKLAEQELEYNKTIETMKLEFEKERELVEKQQLIQKALTNEGCQYPDLIMKQLNLEDVIVKDGVILNADKVILPIKDQYKTVFEKKITGKTPITGNNPPPPRETGKEELVKRYDELQKNGKFEEALKVSRQIKQLQEE
jgi:hypothetical protein